MTSSRERRAECLRLLTERTMGLEADAEWIRARLDQVAALEAGIDDPYDRGEVRLARGRRALRAGMFDVARDALSFARESFLRSGTHRRVGDCSMLLAIAHTAARDVEPAEAAARAARDAYQQWNPGAALQRDVDERLTDATTYLSDLLIRSGRYDDALETLVRERATAEPSSTPPVRITLAAARILAARGQYAAAESLMEAFDLGEDRAAAAERDGTVGVVRAQAGRLADASAPLQTARDRFTELLVTRQDTAAAAWRGPSEDDLEAIARMRVSLAVCETNLGAVLGAQGDHAGALARYEAALAALDAVPMATDRVIECRLNIGVESLEVGDLCRAEESFDVVEQFFAADPTVGPLHAGCLLNVGRLRAEQGRHPEARGRYASAREAFLRLGLVEWAARCGLNLAVSMVVTGAEDAAEELMAAMLVLDRMRFQFPTAGARLAWRTTIAGANQLAFALAADDPELIAELVEHTINSGVHSAAPVRVGTVGAEVELHERLEAPRGEVPHNEGASVRTGAASAAGVLIASAILPMHAPPRLRLPNGTIALHRYDERVRRTYGTGPSDEVTVIDVCPR